MNGKLFFQGWDPEHGAELWALDAACPRAQTGSVQSVSCHLAADPFDAPACATSPPRVLQLRLARLRHLLERAETATPGRAKRLVRSTMKGLKNTRRSLALARGDALSNECADFLGTLLDELEASARGWVAAVASSPR